MTTLEIYKQGQGKSARIFAYALGGGLILFGGIRLYATINVPGREWVQGVPVIGHVSLYNTIAFAVVLLGFLGLHLVLNRPSMADMLIDTEQEMKKVSWPSKQEVWNATLVVVLVTFALALMLYGFDWLLRWFFQLVY
ncbi:MAG: preprotein translocase subunit SecE [Planctomycetota bacterium]